MAGEGPGAACREDAELAALVSEFFSDGTSNQRKQQIAASTPSSLSKNTTSLQWLRHFVLQKKHAALRVYAHWLLKNAQSSDMTAATPISLTPLVTLCGSGPPSSAIWQNCASSRTAGVDGCGYWISLKPVLGCWSLLSRRFKRLAQRWTRQRARRSGVPWSGCCCLRLAPSHPLCATSCANCLSGWRAWGGPQEQAGFLDCILQLCQPGAESLPLGLLLLQTTSEEVGGVPREDRRSGPKREELRRLVEQRTPQVVALLTGVLGIEACRGSVKQALCCVEHLLSCLPLAEVGHELVGALCRWATSALGSGTPQEGSSEEAVLALTCLCEALSRAAAADLGFDCLQLLLRLAITALQTTPTAKDDSYLDKLTEFVRLFVNVYLSRPGNGSAELPQLLRLLFDRTFQETSLERYQVCLEAWGIVLSWMLVTQTGEAYGELVQALVPQLLVRCFQRRGHQLCDRQLSLVSKAAEVRPKDVCSQVLTQLEPELGMYKMGTATAGRLGYLCVLLQALQRLSSLLEPHLVKEVITRLCQVALSGKELLSCADKALAAEAVDV
ncbi:exportin-6-A-like [Haemaphysalis longicornis]